MHITGYNWLYNLMHITGYNWLYNLMHITGFSWLYNLMHITGYNWLYNLMHITGYNWLYNLMHITGYNWLFCFSCWGSIWDSIWSLVAWSSWTQVWYHLKVLLKRNCIRNFKLPSIKGAKTFLHCYRSINLQVKLYTRHN